MYTILTTYSADSTSKDMVIYLKKDENTSFSGRVTCSGNRDANTQVQGGVSGFSE